MTTTMMTTTRLLCLAEAARPENSAGVMVCNRVMVTKQGGNNMNENVVLLFTHGSKGVLPGIWRIF